VLPRIEHGTAADELPEEGVGSARLVAEREEGPRILDRALDLETVADDAGIGEERPHLGRSIGRHLRGIEVREGAAIVLALLEDGGPGEPRLRALEDQELEEPPLVVERGPPLPVVILLHHRVASRPAAARDHSFIPWGLTIPETEVPAKARLAAIRVLRFHRACPPDRSTGAC
jgi:hypothetical protein